MIRLETSSKRLEDVLKIFWRRFCKTSWRRLENVLKTSWQDVWKTSWRRLEDVYPKQIYWCWPRRVEDVLKTSSEDIRLRWTYWSWSRRLEGVFKTSSEDEDKKRLHQDECLLGALIRQITNNKCLRCNAIPINSCITWPLLLSFKWEADLIQFSTDFID